MLFPTAQVTITEQEIEGRFQKRAQNPLLLAAGFDKTDLPIPWLNGKRLRLVIGYLLTGTYRVDSARLSFAAAGQLTMDAAGKVTAADTASFDGEVVFRRMTGSYAMDEGCAGHLEVADESGTANIRFVLSGAAKRIRLVQSDTGWVVSGTAEQQ